jgi:hypothetical protein
MVVARYMPSQLEIKASMSLQQGLCESDSIFGLHLDDGLTSLNVLAILGSGNRPDCLLGE